MLQCKECQNKTLCTGCIQLERHACPKMKEAKDKNIAMLEKALEFTPPNKGNLVKLV